MTQKDIFRESEGDAWIARNAAALKKLKLPEDDPLLGEIIGLPSPGLTSGTKILEIGCGDGTRLDWLRKNREFQCFGLDPSAQAITAAKSRGVAAIQGTADQLPFPDRTFDIVAFGFCLYLCDREDLFRIASEADRVLKNPGWLLIRDFYHPASAKQEYHHRPGLFSHKMDYRKLFTWHPGYTDFSHKVRHHSTDDFTDDAGQWVATSVLRKNVI